MKNRFVFLVLVVLFAQNSSRGEELRRVRVLSYNIHHAEGVDGRLDLQRIAEVIRRSRADVVALQEVDQNTQRTDDVDQASELARMLDMYLAFGGNIELQGGQYGNAMLSRFPIQRHQNHLLPNTGGGEQRGVLEAHINVPGMASELIVLVTHFDHRRDEQQRLDSAGAISAMVDTESQPMVLAGDLNAVPESQTLKIIRKVWTQTNATPMPTIPVDNPARQIDFILYRPAKAWRVIETKVLDESVASDHRPILSELEFAAN